MQTAAVETARRSFERELRDLEEMTKKSARKLVFEGAADNEKDSDGSALDYEGCMQGVEMMLEEFGEEVSELVSADAMGKLHSQVSVSVLQPKLYKMLGMKNQLGTLDKLVEEIRKVYSDRVTKLKADTAKGGPKFEQAVLEFAKDVMVGMHRDDASSDFDGYNQNVVSRSSIRICENSEGCGVTDV